MVVQKQSEMADIDILPLVFTDAFDVLATLRCRDPVSGIRVGNDDLAFRELLGVNPLNIALIPQLGEIVLQRTIAEIGSLIRQVSENRSAREGQARVYEEGEDPLFALLLTHVTTIGGRINTTTDAITILTYWITSTATRHTYPIQGKLFVSTVHRDEATKATRGLVARRWVHPRKPKRTPLLGQRVRAGLREYGTKAMFEDTTRGQESPDRPTTHRLLTDGGEVEPLDNERLNELIAHLTGEGSFGFETEHAYMDVDGFDIDIEADIARGEIWLVADSENPEGEYAMILDADDAAYLADVLARAAVAAQEADSE